MISPFRDLQLIAHVGPPKSGSTSIQANINRHSQTLRDQGTLYPRTGLFHGTHWQLAASFDSGTISRAVYPANMRIEPQDVLARKLTDEILAAGARQVLLSFEGFSAPILQKIRQALGFEKLKVVYVLRRQDELLESWYAHQLKIGRCRDTPEDYFNKCISRIRSPYDHLTKLRALAQLDGAEIDVIVLEKSQLPEGLVAEFFRRVGHHGLTDVVGPRNERLNPKALEAIRNRPGDSDLNAGRGLSLRTALTRVWPSAAEKTAFFTPEQKSVLLDNVAGDNAVIAREFLRRPDERLFDDPTVAQTPVFQSECLTYEEVYRVLEAMWSQHLDELDRSKARIRDLDDRLQKLRTRYRRLRDGSD